MNFTSMSIQNTYQYVTHIESGSMLFDGTGSRINSINISASYATSASYISGSVFTNKLSALSSSAAAICGTVVLSSGTVTVNTTAVTNTSLIFLTGQDGLGANIGDVYVSARSAGVSFTISSTNILNGQTIAWFLLNPV